MKKLVRFLLCLALIASFLPPALGAQAALPVGQTWVKNPSNPVVPNLTCGVSAPIDPALVWESAGHYKMYFNPYPGQGTSIYMAETADGGLTWTCAATNPVLTPGTGGAWDAFRVTGASVVKVDATHYQMWYAGRSAAGDNAIGFATSPNGVTWTKVGTAPVLTVGAPAEWDAQMVREPSVVKVGAVYHMWYEGTAQWPSFSIGHATSADGILWTKDGANPVLSGSTGGWDQNQAYAPSVVYDGATFEMFYSGNNGGVWMTGHATSPDGTVWTKDATAILSPEVSGWDSGDSLDYVGAVLDSGTWKVFYSAAGAGYQMGFATLTPQAQLTFTPLATSMTTGSAGVDVLVDLNAVTDLYGYQFSVTYNPAVVSASAEFVNSFFDTGGQFIPGLWHAECAAGVCQFAVTKVAGLPVSGSGTLARIHFTPLAAGLVPLQFTTDILSTRDAAPIAHTKTVGYLTVFGTATVHGVVSLQGRANPLDAGTVTVYDFYNYAAAVTVPFDPSTGAWSATVPVWSNAITLVASHGLYLSNKNDGATHEGLTIHAGDNYDAGTTRLRGGDADNNGVIELQDLACIGGSFGAAPVTCGTTGSSDINHDTFVNILDLVLPGGNYGLSTPQPW